MKKSSKIILLLTLLWFLAVSVYSIRRVNQNIHEYVRLNHSSDPVESVTPPAPLPPRDSIPSAEAVPSAETGEPKAPSPFDEVLPAKEPKPLLRAEKHLSSL